MEKLHKIEPSFHYTIGIDPDVEKNGVAIVEKETKRLECAALAIGDTLDYLQWVAKRAAESGVHVKVYVEAGWMCRTNWHLQRSDNRGQVVGLCLGMIVMAVICDKAHKAEVDELRKQIEKDSRAYYDAVSQLESEIMTQRNVVKALNDDNVRLRKKLKNKEYEHQS